MGREPLPQMTGAKYFGMQISVTGVLDVEVAARVVAARRAFLVPSPLRARNALSPPAESIRSVPIYQTGV